jgi:hypothetical protein
MTPASSTPVSEPSQPRQFNLSPVVRITLLTLYVALMLPLPFLAQLSDQPVSPQVLWVALGLGAIALWGALSERVCLDETGISVTYPSWFRAFTRKGWSLPWSEVQALKPRTTGQGGLVYYFVSTAGQGYLLPMRVAGFAELVRQVQQRTGIDTTSVRPLAQPWMYFTLFGAAVLLLLVDAWTITAALSLGPQGLA